MFSFIEEVPFYVCISCRPDKNEYDLCNLKRYATLLISLGDREWCPVSTAINKNNALLTPIFYNTIIETNIMYIIVGHNNHSISNF